MYDSLSVLVLHFEGCFSDFSLSFSSTKNIFDTLMSEECERKEKIDRSEDSN